MNPSKTAKKWVQFVSSAEGKRPVREGTCCLPNNAREGVFWKGVRWRRNVGLPRRGVIGWTSRIEGGVGVQGEWVDRMMGRRSYATVAGRSSQNNVLWVSNPLDFLVPCVQWRLPSDRNRPHLQSRIGRASILIGPRFGRCWSERWDASGKIPNVTEHAGYLDCGRIPRRGLGGMRGNRDWNGQRLLSRRSALDRLVRDT